MRTTIRNRPSTADPPPRSSGEQIILADRDRVKDDGATVRALSCPVVV
ncbi:MAG TPA: hypothetical protein VGJ20_33300 [Xanthobacteraceae bacterium]